MIKNTTKQQLDIFNHNNYIYYTFIPLYLYFIKWSKVEGIEIYVVHHDL